MTPRYLISFEQASAHYFDVQLLAHSDHLEAQLVSLPAWLPGSYMIRDFARHIIELKAYCGEMELEIEQVDKQTWRLEPAQGELKLCYRVYAWDLSVRAAHLDKLHGFFNPSSLCLQLESQSHLPHQIEIQLPEWAQQDAWCVATGMPAKAVDDAGVGLYEAEDYDALLDYPFEMGTFSEAGFEAGGVPHRMIYTGANRAALGRIAADVQKICEYQCDLFGGAPFEHYLFMTMVVGSGYGGLEHRNSTALLCSRKDLLTRPDAPQNEDYRNFLGLCSHEYFHSWNVKRIQPKEFQPFDLSEEQYTRQLWAYEGITSYYDELCLRRCEVVSNADYLEMLGKTLSRVSRGLGQSRQTVSDSSFNAWSKFYKQDENAPNAIVSYYTKGAEIALCLDLLLRLHSSHQVTLDDVMRKLWLQHGATGQGTDTDTVHKYCVELLTPHKEDAPALMAFFFHTALETTEELPTADLLECMGVRYQLRPPFSASDKGGKRPKGVPGNALGATVVADSAGVKLRTLFEGEAAEQAGLASGDLIVAIGRTKVSNGNYQQVLNEFVPGQVVEVHAFRHEQLLTLKLTISQPTPTLVELELFDEELAQPWLTGQPIQE